MNAYKWSSYDRIWFSGPDKQEILIFGNAFLEVPCPIVIWCDPDDNQSSKFKVYFDALAQRGLLSHP
jgi:hypothetical protein